MSHDRKEIHIDTDIYNIKIDEYKKMLELRMISEEQYDILVSSLSPTSIPRPSCKRKFSEMKEKGLESIRDTLSNDGSDTAEGGSPIKKKKKGERETEEEEEEEEDCIPEQYDFYSMSNAELSSYMIKKFTNSEFTSQNIYLYGDELTVIVVNHVLTFYLSKYGSNDLYDLSLPLINQRLCHKGVTCDNQNSKLVKRYTPPGKYSLLIFKSGILVGTGPPNQNVANLLTIEFVRDLRNICDYKDVVIGSKKCQNIVAAGILSYDISLDILARDHEHMVTYDSKKFAGAIVRISRANKNPNSITMLVFNTRKVICVGPKNEKELIIAFKNLLVILSKCRI
jgi:TATA-box binding protein (TBP) (component of TFIID and TFIIIB)